MTHAWTQCFLVFLPGDNFSIICPHLRNIVLETFLTTSLSVDDWQEIACDKKTYSENLRLFILFIIKYQWPWGEFKSTWIVKYRKDRDKYAFLLLPKVKCKYVLHMTGVNMIVAAIWTLWESSVTVDGDLPRLVVELKVIHEVGEPGRFTFV